MKYTELAFVLLPSSLFLLVEGGLIVALVVLRTFVSGRPRTVIDCCVAVLSVLLIYGLIFLFGT
jgi:hypothetical protein